MNKIIDNDKQQIKASVRAHQAIFECVRDNSATILF